MNIEEKTDYTLSDIQTGLKVADLKEGTHVGRYQILSLIGKGGMGAVYKAYDPELDRSIAIKILTVRPLEGETASRPQARLMREAQALAKLNHPNVVSIFDVGTFEDGVYIAMEYVKGKTLREWAKDNPIQKEIVKVLSEAGKGLQAAHTEGIVHRDFKPDNVIIGDNGQVKVLDFGLARAAGSVETIGHHEKPTSEQEITSGERLLSTPITRVGAMVGTTVYMAPEHFNFQELDEKTDQFSFCVTLFEVLYGQRPFPAKTVEELEENITSGWIEIPQEANVPKWIEETIRKGISVTKDDRYASMLELLDALENDPEIARAKRYKKLMIGTVILLLTAMTVGFGYFAFFRGSKICTGAAQKVADVWNDKKKAKIRQAFTNTKLSYANDSFDRVERGFGDYLNKWANAYTQTCEATRLRDEQPVEIMVMKMGCLEKHLIDAGALAKVFGEADKTAVVKAVQAVASLPGLSNCNDVEALQSKIPLPADEKIKKKVAGIREKLAEVVALEKTGKYRKGVELAQSLRIKAEAIEYQPVQAEVLYTLGRLFDSNGEYKESEIALVKATRMAGRCRDSLLVARAMVLLVPVVGYRQARHEAALLIGRDAEVMLDVSGGNDSVRSSLFNNLGIVHRNLNDFKKALEYYRKSLRIREKALGSEHFELAHPLNNLGVVYRHMGEYDKALECYNKSLTIREKTLGPNHPHVTATINNMGIVYLIKGNNKKALECYRKSLAIRERTLGPNHSLVATVLTNMASIYVDKGDYQKAHKLYSRAMVIREKALGPNHPEMAYLLTGVGILLVKQKRFFDALTPLERLVNICEKKTCEPEQYGLGLFDLSRALIETTGDKERARKLARQARNLFRKTPKAFTRELEKVDAWLAKHQSTKGTTQLRLSKSPNPK